MPKFLEDKLKAEAAAKGFTGERAARYVYGGLNNIGAMRGNKETPKGAEMQRKHDEDVKMGRNRPRRIRVRRRKDVVRNW